MGDKYKKFDIADIIRISSNQVTKLKNRATKRLSSNFISQILAIYQKEMNAAPVDLMKCMQVAGHLMLRNYRLSPNQLNSLAVTIPYILNLRYINLENCGMCD